MRAVPALTVWVINVHVAMRLLAAAGEASSAPRLDIV